MIDEKLFFPDEKLSNYVPNVPNVPIFDLSATIKPIDEEVEAAKRVIDEALETCKENPGVLGSDEFIAAYKTINQDQSLAYEYRDKIKKAKPSGVPMADIDASVAPPSEANASESVASELIELVQAHCSLIFDAQADKCFVSIDKGTRIETLAIGSKPFTEWLSYQYYNITKACGGNNRGKSASEASIKQACFALSGIAKHEGDKQRVYLRVADHNGGHYLFIGDEQLRVIEVLPTGWRILEQPPVKFWMPSSMQSLPVPQTGGDLSLLWNFINIPELDRPLVLAWVLEALRSETPKPILALSGTQGSAKSSTQSKIRQLIDNNAVNLRAAPKTIEDVFVSAGVNWLVSFENLSHLTPAMQDALCTLATGGGFASRTLHTNSDETIIEVKRPVIVNSIPSVITAQDLTDRAISIELPPIEYREETEINAKWELAKPLIFGGLLDLFVKTLAQLPQVKLVKPPRMADFTRLGEAMMQAQGHNSGTFDALYKANRAESIGRALESSPIATAICDLVDDYNGISNTVFHGTVKDLLTRLADKYRHDAEGWPRSAKGLSGILKRQLPALHSIGIDVELGRKHQRIGSSQGIPVTIRKYGNIGNIGNVVSEFSAPKKKFLEDSEVF